MEAPFFSDDFFTLHVGDALETLRTMPDGSVNCVVTSPPYWGLRDYGTGSWEGGDESCDHKAVTGEPRKFTNGRGEGLDDDYAGSNLRAWTTRDGTTYRDVCGKCGARRVDRQLGLEATPDLYVANMVAVFREVRRVLADDGTCWVNLGDSYASAWVCDRRNVVGSGSLVNGKREDRPNRLVGGLKEKDLVGIPWRVAFALQADGWYLRSDIIWAKPNPMPESVTDRPTKAHEYVFLLSKQPRYWFDADAVRERYSENLNSGGPATTIGARGNGDRNDSGRPNPARGPDGRRVTRVVGKDGSEQHRDGERWPNPSGRNVRSVWSIATQPYPNAHFATFPEELARRCILAGCPEWVCDAILCGKCGESHPDISARHLDAFAQGLPVPDAVQEELRRVRDLLREQESARLLAEVQRQAGGVHEGHEDEGREDQPSRLHPSVDAGLSVRDDGEGLRAGTSLRDGAAPRPEVGVSREGSPSERGQGGQPLVESVGGDDLDAPWRGGVPVLRDALLRSLTCSCGSTGFRTCGKPRERIVERGESDYSRLKGERDWRDLAEISREQGKGVRPGQSENRASHANHTMTERGTVPSLKPRAIIGTVWGDCSCPPPSVSKIEQGVATRISSGESSPSSKYRPGVVLDPFAGSGTVAVVARRERRATVAVELNPEYASLAVRRYRGWYKKPAAAPKPQDDQTSLDMSGV